MVLTNKSRIKSFLSKLAGKEGRVRVQPYRGARIQNFDLDKVKYPGFGNGLANGKMHSFTGSAIKVIYKAKNPPTKEQIKKAEYATKILKINRQQYTGWLLSVFRHKGKLYMIAWAILERDRENNKFKRNFRIFNISEGEVKRLEIEERVGRMMGPQRINISINNSGRKINRKIEN